VLLFTIVSPTHAWLIIDCHAMAGTSNKPATRSSAMDKPKGIDQALWSIIESVRDEAAANKLAISKMITDNKLSEINGLNETVRTPSGRLMRAETVIQRLIDENTERRSYSMKHNLIISLSRQSTFKKPEEQPMDTARRFFCDEMKVSRSDEIYIPLAHYLGNPSPRNRPLLVRVPEAEHHYLVMTNLAGSGHSISRQLPAERRERKQYVLPFKDKKKDRNAKAKLQDD
jgi:hypothetical protein